MKIIGWERKGNLVRFCLGLDDLDYWSGDDWDDAPYEHNAVTTPLFGIEEDVDIVFDFETQILEAADDYHYHGNSPFSMDDFKERKAPILIIDNKSEYRSYYSEHLGDQNLCLIYMGDKFEEIQ